MSTTGSADTARWPVPSAPPAYDGALLARAMRDLRLTWRARGVLAELTTGYSPGQEPTISELISMNRDERGPVVEGREAFRKAVNELRGLGYLTPSASTVSGVGERLVVDLSPAAEAHLLQSYGHAPAATGS